MKRKPLSLVATACLVATATCHAQGPRVNTDCLLMILDQVELAARRDGIIEQLRARVGDEVSQGQLIIQLSDREANANLMVAQAKHAQAVSKAENKATVTAAEVELQRSTKEVALLSEVGRVPYLEVFRAENTQAKNAAELEVAKMTHQEDIHASRVTQAELQVAQIDVQDRRTLSPIDGIIVTQLKYQGDWCNKGDSVVKILRMDRLMLQGIVNVRDLSPSAAIGMKATATFELAGEEPIVMNDLTISKISPEVDLDGNYLIWTFIDNRKIQSKSGSWQWLLRPGISGTLEIR